MKNAIPLKRTKFESRSDKYEADIHILLSIIHKMDKDNQ